MKLAITINEDVATAVAMAKEHGVDGVELLTGGEGADAFRTGGVEVASILTDIAMHPGARGRAVEAQDAEVRRHVDRAAAADCRRVRLLDPQGAKGEVAATAVAMAQWLLPLADYAADLDVTLLVENRYTFRAARQMWMLLESVNHPGVAACWDVTAGARAGQSPAVVVPTLNSRIGLVRVRDTSPDDTVEQMLTRLRGIGYRGYVTVESPAEGLASTLAKVRAWFKPPAAKVKPTPAK